MAAPRAFGERFGPGFGGPLNVGTLVLKVGTIGPDPAYQDGDILCAFNRRRTRHVHAEHLCHPRLAQRASNGRIPLDHVSRAWFEATHQYRFTRVSPTTVVRENLWTHEVDVIGATPNERGEYMDVGLYVRRRQQAAGFGLFGPEGAEIWYGGNTRADTPALDAAWSAIEQHTSLREADFPDWPIGAQELRSHLVIRVDDFDDAEETALVAPVQDESGGTPVLVRKRARRLPWRDLHGMSAARIAQVEDRLTAVDIRAERKHVRAVSVRLKD